MGLVAPWSSLELDLRRENGGKKEEGDGVIFDKLWRYDRHLNLDDLDIVGEGVGGTLRRVLGRRGLVVWGVRRVCDGQKDAGAGLKLGRDW